MATRVIDNKRDRLTTILVAPLMTCSARIPVYTLIISAFIPDRDVLGFIGLQGLVMFGLYAAEIVSALASRSSPTISSGATTSRRRSCSNCPTTSCRALRSVLMGIYMRAMMFLKRAGTTIFSMMVLIWFLASFPRPPEGATQPAIDFSLAAIIGRWIEPILAPVGFNWQISVALIPGMAAREVAVASLGTVYAIEGGKEAAEQIGQALASKWSLATALALLVWYIFAPQCASTLAVIKRETGSWRWVVDHFRLHAGAGLRRLLHHLQRRRRARRGLSRFAGFELPRQTSASFVQLVARMERTEIRGTCFCPLGQGLTTDTISPMAVYLISPDKIEPLPETSFPQRGIKERADLQRLLRANISVVAPDVLVIAEEFAEWTTPDGVSTCSV